VAPATRRRPLIAIQPGAGKLPRPSCPPSDDALNGRQGLPADWHLAAVEQAADAIVVADLAGRIQYANPMFVRDAGVQRDGLIGQAASWLAVAETPDAAATEALWSAIRRGDVWRGELTTRRPNGTLAHAEATAAPVRDVAGAVVGVVAIMRDASSQRAIEARVDVSRLERTALVTALGTMRSGDAPGATSAAILLALLGFHAFGSVAILSFEPDGGVIPLATLDRAGRPLVLTGSLPASRCAYLRERASKGPWIENWDPGADHPYRDAAAAVGAGVLAYMPIRSEDVILGLLIASSEKGAELELAERLPALVECASVAGALLGPQVRSRNVRTLGEARIRTIIADRAFLPVFQPIVELASRAVVGYEALTRFADGSRPDEVFAAAARCGLAIDLEAATLRAALKASEPLPSNSAWLNLNVSAELVLAGEPLASILRHQGWQIVLELTEHIEVTDYAVLRAALERLGPSVRLAVDDAGAGFASLRHILELRPDYVKLDLGIVHGVDRDPARQALIAGMVHFAAKTGAVLVAEGVETEAEARQLRQLGVVLGQGFRLGRPALAGRIAAPLVQGAGPAGNATARQTRQASSGAEDTISHAVNIGEILAAGLREAGVGTVADLRALGAVAAWERLRETTPRLATAATLIQLEGATRGRRVTQLSPAERARLRLFVRLHGRAASA
jgi:PAS domain S-box-containing protein